MCLTFDVQELPPDCLPPVIGLSIRVAYPAFLGFLCCLLLKICSTDSDQTLQTGMSVKDPPSLILLEFYSHPLGGSNEKTENLPLLLQL